MGILFPSKAKGNRSETSVLNTVPTALTSEPLNGPPPKTCACRSGAISRAWLSDIGSPLIHVTSVRCRRSFSATARRSSFPESESPIKNMRFQFAPSDSMNSGRRRLLMPSTAAWPFSARSAAAAATAYSLHPHPVSINVSMRHSIPKSHGPARCSTSDRRIPRRYPNAHQGCHNRQ